MLQSKVSHFSNNFKGLIKVQGSWGIFFRSGCHWSLTGFGQVDLFRAKELKRDRWSRLCASTEAECGTLETGDHPSSPQQGVGDERTTQAPGRRVTFVYAGKGTQPCPNHLSLSRENRDICTQRTKPKKDTQFAQEYIVHV